MRKHKLIELQKIVEEKIRSLKEEVEIGTNVKLITLHSRPKEKSLTTPTTTDRHIRRVIQLTLLFSLISTVVINEM